MAVIIGMVSQKGGVGKSALARTMAVEFTKEGYNTLLADLDFRQETSVDWKLERDRNGHKPVIDVQGFEKVHDALAKQHSYDVVILDTHGKIEPTILDVLKQSDLVIVPTSTSKDERIPTIINIKDFVGQGFDNNRLVVALMRTATLNKELLARQEIEAEGINTLRGSIPYYLTYENCLDVGKALTETGTKSLDDRATTVIDSVLQKLVEVMELQNEVA